ncbi:MAG: terminase large subunit [Oscillospiraceae bacterium]|nr:terminase large subunit [Oscillospiraceae bacterium]
MDKPDRVTAYAESVAAGEVVCGELHRLACLRHLRNLADQRTASFPYYWDVDEANRVLDYAESLTIAEGTDPAPVQLLPSQVFDLGCTFGWKKVSNGKRRFRRRYKSVARQNGKTFENGIMGTYIAGFSGYRHGKLFTAATKKRQARLAWEEMSKFVRADPDLGELFKVKDYKSLIVATLTECTIEALSREGGLDDGFRAIFVSIDELHQHLNNAVYKALYNGTRALLETLISMITTRGKKLNSFCKEMDDYAIQILRGTATAEDMFVDIFCLDPQDDIWDERNWIKANPFLCADEERLETLRQDAQTAKDMGGQELVDFLTKSLNMWVKNTDDQFIDPDAWKACESDRTIQDITDSGVHDCWVGIDLSSGGDLTTIALEFDLGDGISYLFSHSFMPRGRLEEHMETDLAPYDLWEQMGLITVTGGSTDYMNDYKFIISYLSELKERYGLHYLGIGIDPHNAAGVMQDLEAFGCDVVTITQSARNLNDATVAVQLLTKGKKFEYDRKNELLTWSVTNAAIVRNSFGEIKVDKKPGARFKRIDPVDAIIDAHALMLLSGKTGNTTAAVDAGLDRYLEMMGWR